jgi:hypothetical protein
VLRTALGFKREEVTRGWKNLHSNHLSVRYTAPYFKPTWSWKSNAQKRNWRCCSGLWCRVDSVVDTNVSEKHRPYCLGTVGLHFHVREKGGCPSSNPLHFPPPSLQPWRWRQYVSPKRWYLPMSLHGVINQKTSIDIFTAVRTWSLMKLYCWFMWGVPKQNSDGNICN